MASAHSRHQMVQLLSIADARTRRALAAVAGAQKHLDAVRHELEQRRAGVTKAEQNIALAEQEIRREPANEQHRLWLGHCHMQREIAEAARDEAKFRCDEAATELASAQNACQRQQVRHEYIEGAAQRLKKEFMRETERRTEDDQQGSGMQMPIANLL